MGDNEFLINFLTGGEILVAVADLLIVGLAFMFLQRRLPLESNFYDRYKRLIQLFAFSVTCCGVSHVTYALVIFHPVYWFQAIWTMITGCAILGTAFLFICYDPSI